MLVNTLKENNVNSEGMRFDPGARTALAFVTLKKDGEREFMFYRNPSADMLLQESELDFDLIKKVTMPTLCIEVIQQNLFMYLFPVDVVHFGSSI